MRRSMEIETPLGDDVLLFHRMHAREELSRLGEFQLDLLNDPTKTKPIVFDDILGKNVTVRVQLQDESTRHFNGFVTRFASAGRLGRYLRFTATVSPWAWFMTRTADCRIFQEKTVRQILEEVFADHPMADFKFELTESYEKWTYCVQYRETDFNFVSRLMEHEGIYYYYRHGDGAHTMVLTDSIGKHECFPGYETIKYIRPQERVRPEIEHINTWEFFHQVQPGVFSLDDYDFERPGVDLRLNKPVPRKYKPSDYEWFDYPGLFTQKNRGEQLAQVRGEEFGSQFERATGEANARGVHVGSIFKLDGCPWEEQNCKHLVVSSVHDLEYSDYEAMPEPSGSDYRCTFVAMTTAQQFRPQRTTPKPFVQGPQTAVVVGPGGEEIYTDKYGRVKVQFHWDSRGQQNEQSSCWIRVSHPWAGKGWGSVATPRIGQEVIVDFLEGDPDQPIITGRVYNAANLPPFGFPAGAVLSGVKSDTHKGGGYNEMSLDDTAGKERVFIHGQYNMDTVIEHDQTSTIHNCRTDVIDIDDSETVGGNQTLHVVKNQTVNIDQNRTETVGANETITVKAHRSETVNAGEDVTVTGARIHTVNGAQMTTISLAEAHTVGAARKHTVGAAEAISVGAMQVISVGASQTTNVGANQSTSVGANQTLQVARNQSNTIGGNQTTGVAKNASTTVGADEKHDVKGARQTTVGKDDVTKVTNDVVIEAGDSVLLKTGDAMIMMQKNGDIAIKGKNIIIQGSAKISVKADGDVVVKGSKIAQN